MGIEHIIKDIDASELNVGYSPLIPFGLEYINFFGGTMPQGRNLAPSKPQASVVGSPVVGSMAAGTAFRQGANYIQTQVAHAQRMTFMVIAAPDGDGEYPLIGNFAAPANNVLLRMRTGGAGTGQIIPDLISAYTRADAVVSNGSTSAPAVAANRAYTVGARISGVVGESPSRINNLTTGQASSSGTPIPLGAAQNVGGALRIGSGYSVTGTLKDVRILFAAIWSRQLSDQEMAEQAAQLKEFYASAKGIAV